jgi:hypothetical protein
MSVLSEIEKQINSYDELVIEVCPCHDIEFKADNIEHIYNRKFNYYCPITDKQCKPVNKHFLLIPVESNPLSVVRPLVEKLEAENADLKQKLDKKSDDLVVARNINYVLRAKIDKVVLLLDAVESDRALFRQVKEILAEELK